MQSNKISPTVLEPSPAELAFEEFRKVFPVINGCRVDSDGRFMNYSLKTMQGAFRNFTRAQQIITQQKLPLTAKMFSDYCNHIVHIQYAGA